MRLVSMYGKPQKLGTAPQYAFSLFSLSGNSETMNDPILSINPVELSDLDAGIQVLYAIEKAYPGITLGELISMRKNQNTMGKGLLDTLGDLGNWVADKTGAVGDKLGEWAGSGIRLLTDKEVRDGITSYASGYATGGASMGIEGLFQQLTGGSGNPSDLIKMLSGIGSQSKADVKQAGFAGMDFGNINPAYLMIGGGALILLVLLMK